MTRRHHARRPAPWRAPLCLSCRRGCAEECRCDCHRARHPSSLPAPDGGLAEVVPLRPAGDVLDAFTCRHGRLFLSCDDDCPDQARYLAEQEEQIRTHWARLDAGAREAVRATLGLPAEGSHEGGEL